MKSIRSARLRPVVSVDELRELQHAIEDVYLDPVILRWIVELVQASRDLEAIALGASVRASLALERAARSWALIHGRDYVWPADVEALFIAVLGHRILFTPAFLAEARRMGETRALERIPGSLLRTRAPRPEPDAEHELQVLGARE